MNEPLVFRLEGPSQLTSVQRLKPVADVGTFIDNLWQEYACDYRSCDGTVPHI